jgi:hypothetical protein
MKSARFVQLNRRPVKGHNEELSDGAGMWHHWNWKEKYKYFRWETVNL